MSQSTVRIAAFAGSSRTGSVNQVLLAAAMDGAREAGAEVMHIDLRAPNFPIYDGDYQSEYGIPAVVKEMRAQLASADAFLIASPEYNSSISPLLKNVIDWTSRSDGDDAMLSAWRGRAAAILSATPGAGGGLRGLLHLRDILQNIGMIVLPKLVTMGGAFGKIEDGKITDEAVRQRAHDLGQELTHFARRQKAD